MYPSFTSPRLDKRINRRRSPSMRTLTGKFTYTPCPALSARASWSQPVSGLLMNEPVRVPVVRPILSDVCIFERWIRILLD